MASKQLTKLKAETNDFGGVKLSFYFSTETFQSLQEGNPAHFRIWRQEEPGFTFNQDYEEFFDGIRHHNAEILFEGELAPINRRKFEFVDRNARFGCTYCYWVACLDQEGLPTGPVGIKVRDPQVWWPCDKIGHRVEEIARGYPEEVAVHQVGLTTQNRPLSGIHIGNRKHCLALIGAIHAGESGPELIFPVLENLLENDRELLSRVGIATLPAVNLDERERQARGFPPYLRTNANGVDLNRNFPADWEAVDCNYGLISSDPDAITYRGPFPASENETQAVIQFIQHARPRVVFSFHCLAGICAPVFLTSKFAGEDRTFTEDALPLLAAYAQGYYGDTRDSIPKYGCSAGSLPHWLYQHAKIPGFDLEWDGDESTRPCLTDETTPEMIAACAHRHYLGIREVLKKLA